ncbi:PREDICTED: E3 ubiquitin-protein ligase PUB23-like [Ipomoea nil]|uniref:E3 ubiquitin-protein ligase PUB23-like n=1 Tax=Ipomoea nil TaxID=35883 RepID=UPI000901B0B0|nr:PREDICTED: E3 ubiquitin-protein ligase PUB23-like [Ipomoea nil]
MWKPPITQFYTSRCKRKQSEPSFFNSLTLPLQPIVVKLDNVVVKNEVEEGTEDAIVAKNKNYDSKKRRKVGSLKLVVDVNTISSGLNGLRETRNNKDQFSIWANSLQKMGFAPIRIAEMMELENGKHFVDPKFTLRRIIQSWCTLHASHGVERFPTTKPPVTKSHILKLPRQAKSTPEMQTKVLQTLRSLASENAANKRCMENAGVAEFLAAIIITSNIVDNKETLSFIGAATVLIDLLLDTNKKRYCEWSLSVLEQLCRCAEGRAELLKHAVGLAVVSRKILRVSQVANERGLRILYSIAKFSATPSVVQEMLQLGVGAKLCLVIQVDCGVGKNKERAAEILKLHAKEGKNSPCLPLDLIHNTIGVN